MIGHYIGGQFTQDSDGGALAIFNPATEQVIETVARGGPSDAYRALASSIDAYASWRKISAYERAEMLHEAAGKMLALKDSLAILLTMEEGKPNCEALEEIEWTVRTFRYYAELGQSEYGRTLPPGEWGQMNLVIKEPYGPVLCIVPWNYPLLLMAWKVAPALMAGNTTIIKPSELTPLTTLYLARHCFDHFPAGVINVLLGPGLEVAEPLVKHPDLPVIAFTGSLETGQRIASIAAPMMKHLHLELGGKDAFVVGPDVDPELAARALAYAALTNCGQVCTSTERIYLPRAKADLILEALVAHVQSLIVGPGSESGTDIGPMIGARYREKVEQHIADARRQGARILTGGQRPHYLPQGFYLEPTVLTDVHHRMLIMEKETFGPALPCMLWDDFEQAIALVNDSPYGLGACLMTEDQHLVQEFIREARVGTVWINDLLTDHIGGPFGGMKMSGGARELGPEGLDAFRQPKHVHWQFQMGPKKYWFPYGRKEGSA